MAKIKLSQSKINQLRIERNMILGQIKEYDEIESIEGTLNYAHRDAAVSEVRIEPKRRRLHYLERILKSVLILPDRVNSSKIILGSYAKLEFHDGKIKKFRLVHPIEASPQNNLLSIDSPIGIKLLNKKTNDKIQLPNGIFATIIEVD